MLKLNLTLCTGLAFVAGLFVGSTSVTSPQELRAAHAQEGRVSDETLTAFEAGNRRMRALTDLLVSEELHKPATADQNFFGASVGGIDSYRDLEEGRGVDPETFAALYADRSVPEIAEHLEFDKEGRLRYKGDIVRMYSRTKLKEVFNRRDILINRTGGRVQ